MAAIRMVFDPREPRFGDIYRVFWGGDPVKQAEDDRRWMFIGYDPSALGDLALLNLDGNRQIISHWENLTGFERVDDE